MSSPPAETPALRDYEISGVIATGATGTFYAGKHRLTGHPVALQRLAPQLADAAGFVDRLGNAARRVASLRNAHVVGVYDLVVEDGVYLVLELVGGPSLRALAPSGQVLPPATALAAVDDVLNALESAHAEGIVHGDIRAEHVLVAPQGIAKLGGFAVSQAQLLLPNHPGAKRPGYSSPERLAGMPPDPRSDLYGAAAMASELMTGYAPSPGRIGPPALPAISEVLRRGLSADASRRYGTATELRAALVGAVAGSLGPSWRLASDLGTRAATAMQESGSEAAAAGAAGAAAAAAVPGPPSAGATVPGFGVPPPPDATVMQGAIPPPPVARPPSSPPSSYLPPPEPRARAAITEIDGDERQRPPWLVPLLAILALLVVGGAVAAVLLLAVGGGGSNNGPLQIGPDVKLSVDPQQGGCDTTFQFAATGSVSGVGTMRFRWEQTANGQTGVTDDIPVDITSNDGSFRLTRAWKVTGSQKLNGTMTFRIVSPTERVVHQAISYSCP